MRFARFAVAAALAVPLSLGAQTIDPGFSRVQVEQKFGPPAAARSVGEFTYLFFNNGCEITCGQHDIVTLRNDKVTDAILRGTARNFSGRSTSPSGRAHQATSPSDAPPPAAKVPAAAAKAPAPASVVIPAPAQAAAPAATSPANAAATTAKPATAPAKPVPTPGSGSAALPKKP